MQMTALRQNVCDGGTEIASTAESLSLSQTIDELIVDIVERRSPRWRSRYARLMAQSGAAWTSATDFLSIRRNRTTLLFQADWRCVVDIWAPEEKYALYVDHLQRAKVSDFPLTNSHYEKFSGCRKMRPRMLAPPLAMTYRISTEYITYC